MIELYGTIKLECTKYKDCICTHFLWVSFKESALFKLKKERAEHLFIFFFFLLLIFLTALKNVIHFNEENK